MVTGWLLYRKEDAKRNSHNITFYERACQRRRACILLRYIEDFSFDASGRELTYAGVPIKEIPEFAVMRADIPAFSGMLEGLGIRVFNCSLFSEIANDKEKTLQQVKAAGIKTPETRAAKQESALLLSEELGYPLVIKPKDGHGGQGVLWAGTERCLKTLLATYPYEEFLLQRPVSELGRDLRVYVLGGEIVAAMLREQDNDFRSNYCLGGSARVYDLSLEEKALVHRVMDLFPIDYAGVDFMFHEGQLVLNEIEDVVGARMLYHLTDIDIVDLYIEYILKQIS